MIWMGEVVVKDKIYIKQHIRNYFWVYIFLVFSIFFIFQQAIVFFNSDSAATIIYAREQFETGQIFPDGWYYGTAVWYLNLNVLVLLFHLFFQDWILCRELAVVLQTILAIVILIFLMKKIIGNTKLSRFLAALSALMILTPLSSSIIENFFMQATYMTSCIKLMFSLLLLFYVFVKSESELKARHYYYIAICFIFLNIRNIASLVTISIPLLGTLIIYVLLKNEFEITEILKEKKIIKIICAIIIGTIIGLAYLMISHRFFKMYSNDGSLSFYAGEETFLKIGEFLRYMLNLYGIEGTGKIFSFVNIVRNIRCIFAVILEIIVPLALLLNYKKIKSEFQKIVVLFGFTMHILLIYIAIFSQPFTSRYYLNVYLLNIILFCVWCDNFVLKKRYLFHVIFYLVLIFITVPSYYLCSWQYFRGDRNTGTIEIAQGTGSNISVDKMDMVKFMKEKELKYGYASFWRSYSLSALSDFEPEIVAVNMSDMTPYLWLNSARYYSKNYYDGPTFLLLTDEEYEEEVNEDVLQSLGEPVEEYKYYNYNFLVYDYNIATKFLFFDEHLLEKKDLINHMKLSNAVRFKKNEAIAIKINKEGFISGPYIKLPKGEYRIRVEINYQGQKNPILYIGGNGIEYNGKKRNLVQGVNVLDFAVKRELNGLDVQISGVEHAEITGISLERLAAETSDDSNYLLENYFDGNAELVTYMNLLDSNIYVDDSEKKNYKIVLGNEGLIYSPSFKLAKGSYELRISTDQSRNSQYIFLTINGKIKDDFVTYGKQLDNGVNEMKFDINSEIREMEIRISGEVGGVINSVILSKISDQPKNQPNLIFGEN